MGTVRTLVLHECLDTVPLLIHHLNTICQAVAKSSQKLPSSCPTGCSFPLNASDRDAHRLPLLRKQVPAHLEYVQWKKGRRGGTTDGKGSTTRSFFRCQQDLKGWRALICPSRQCLGLTGVSRVQDGSSVQKLQVQAGFRNGRGYISVIGWRA